MLRSVLIAVTAFVLLAVGAMTAAAGNRHANSASQLAAATRAGAITTLTTGAMLEVKARNDEEQAQAAQAAAAAAPAQAAPAPAAQAQADQQTGPDTDDEQDNADDGESGD